MSPIGSSVSKSQNANLHDSSSSIFRKASLCNSYSFPTQFHPKRSLTDSPLLLYSMHMTNGHPSASQVCISSQQRSVQITKLCISPLCISSLCISLIYISTQSFSLLRIFLLRTLIYNHYANSHFRTSLQRISALCIFP